MIRTSVFDRHNTLLTEIEPVWDSIAWRLNNVGRAKFFMPYSDPKCTPDNLKLGNRIYCDFDDGLSPFGGIIELPRNRDSNGVKVIAYTGERLLDWRRTPKGRYFAQQQAGYIYRTLINEENATWPLGIDVGSVYRGGDARTLEYHFHDILARFKDLAKLTGFDFAIIPNYTDGVLTFKAKWYESRGSDLSNKVVLEENVNCSGVVLDEQGPVGNRIILVGAGSTWGDERITSIVEDTDSIAQYGLIEYAEVQTGVSNQSTLDTNAESLLEEMKEPRTNYKISQVLNVKPALFAQYEVGDTIKLHAHLNAGAWDPIDMSVRVIAREWHPDGTCRLEVI